MIVTRKALEGMLAGHDREVIHGNRVQFLERGDARLLEDVYSEVVGEHEPISGFRPVPARSIENLVKAVFNLLRKADRPVARDRPRRGCPDQDRG